MRKNKGFKMMMIILTILCIVGLTACSSGDKKEAESQQETTYERTEEDIVSDEYLSQPEEKEGYDDLSDDELTEKLVEEADQMKVEPYNK